MNWILEPTETILQIDSIRRHQPFHRAQSLPGTLTLSPVFGLHSMRGVRSSSV